MDRDAHFFGGTRTEKIWKKWQKEQIKKRGSRARWCILAEWIPSLPSRPVPNPPAKANYTNDKPGHDPTSPPASADIGRREISRTPCVVVPPTCSFSITIMDEIQDTSTSAHIPILSIRKMVEKKPCSVCGEAGDGAHFGAEACRACAAFFRRSVALQKQYTCRNGGTCPIEATIRCMCRACRYEKCLKVGMRKTAVQRHRDMLGKREEEASRSEADCPTLAKEPVSEQVGMPTLCTLRDNYRLMNNIRKVLHNREGDSVFAKREPRVVDYKEANEINKKEVGLVADFLVNSFPDFQLITSEQKTLLYRNFFLSFIMLETGYFCAINNRTDIFYLSTGDYIDTNRPETFYTDKTGIQPMSTEDAIRIFAPSFSIYRRNLLEPMRIQKVDDIEFFALCCFVLWDHGLEGQSEQSEAVAIKVRQRIVDELIFYYRNVKKYKEPADRLSSMMILLPPLQRSVRRFQEDVEISHVFKAYAVNDEFYEIINGRF